MYQLEESQGMHLEGQKNQMLARMIIGIQVAEFYFKDLVLWKQ